MKTDPRFLLVLLCFFASGFAALLYETAWAREFAFVFGTSELAVVSVLAAYMAGLAAGAAVAARFISRIRRPVLVYGLLELGIAASALAVPWAIRGARWIQAAAVGGRSAPPDEASVSGALFYVASSFVILIVPTGLMGATLPLLARHAVRREEEIGRRVGALYAINTAGAVAGALATGFVLLPALGLRLTSYAGAATNALVFFAAALLARHAAPLSKAQSPDASSPPRFHWVLPLVALSGVASFTYELVWTRLLGHLLGGSIQAFSTMLASFLLGIAIGSAVSARLARDSARSARGFAAAQIGTAVLALTAFAAVDRLPDLARALGAGHAGSPIANVLIAVLGLLPGALCIGAVFPFAVRLLARHEANAAPATARVYAWNTLGSITGALVTGFVLLPTLHFVDTLRLAAGLNLLLAVAAAWLIRPPLRLAAGIAAAGIALLIVQPPAIPWAVLRHRGGTAGVWGGEIEYYGVGRSSTVVLYAEPSGWRLTTNSLSESGIDRAGPAPDSYPTARWLGMLPVLLRPDARSMLIIGLGGGLTLEAVPSTVEAIDVIELEREVVRANEVLEPLRASPLLSAPRVRLVVNDARGALLLTDARFDAIVSQPSHPWTMGASHLYTLEFFRAVAKHLEPGGILIQWIDLNLVDEALLRSLVATLLEVYPHVGLFQPVPGSVLFAASDAPLDPVASSARAMAKSPADYARFGLRRAEDFATAWSLDSDDARHFSQGASINTDDRNQLATRSSGLGKKALHAEGGSRLMLPYNPLRSKGAPLDRIYMVRRLASQNRSERARQLAESGSDPVERLTALGWAMSRISPQRAFADFQRALARDPTSQSARFGLMRVRRRAVETRDPEYLRLADPLEGAAAAVVAGWRHVAEGDFRALSALDSELLAADPLDPSYDDALRLRIRWRAESEDPALRAQATEIAREILSANPVAEDAVVAARAFAASERPVAALQVLDFLSHSPRTPNFERAGLEILDALPAEVDPAHRDAVRSRLTRPASAP